MIEALLPETVRLCWNRGDPPEATLFPQEREVVAHAVAKRRDEFTTVRWCARTALAQLGVAPVPILPGDRGAPRWPAGIVGSMTHCAGYRAAAVALSSDLSSIGVDAEPNQPLPRGVLDTVALPAEQSLVRRLLRERPEVRWDRLLFSAKEATYKAWFPLTGRWLGFEEAMITFDPVAGGFNSQLLVAGARVGGDELTGFTGRWAAHDGLVATAIAVP